jgi:hypothetical protein
MWISYPYLLDIEPWFLCRPARSLVTIPTTVATVTNVKMKLGSIKEIKTNQTVLKTIRLPSTSWLPSQKCVTNKPPCTTYVLAHNCSNKVHFYWAIFCCIKHYLCRLQLATYLKAQLQKYEHYYHSFRAVRNPRKQHWSNSRLNSMTKKFFLYFSPLSQWWHVHELTRQQIVSSVTTKIDVLYKIKPRSLAL